MSLTSEQKQFIEELSDYATDTFGFDTKAVHMAALVFLGERDGCLIGVDDSNELEYLTDLCEEYDIPYTSESSGIFLAASSSHLSRNNPKHADARTTGEFLGYPDDAIEFYIGESNPIEKYEEFMKNHSTLTLPDVERLDFIEYIPAPSEEAVQRAKDREQSYKSALSRCGVSLPSFKG